MKKPSSKKKATTPAKTKPESLTSLLTEVRQLIQSARRGVATVVDTFQVMTNFEIGRRIVEHEQKGAKRAAYGAELLKELSARLTEEFGRGFSRSNLQNMRSFFLLWEDRVPKICQQPIGKLVEAEISQQPVAKSGSSKIFQTVSEKSGAAKIRQQAIGKSDAIEISQQAIGESGALRKSQTPSDQFPISEQPIRRSPFTLSWTHFTRPPRHQSPRRNHRLPPSARSPRYLRKLTRNSVSALDHRERRCDSLICRVLSRVK